MARQSSTNVLVHVVWSTRGRRATIASKDDTLLASMLRDGARRVGCELLAIGNASNHVHVIARLARGFAIATLVQSLKGRTSYFGGWKWQRGYFAESVAPADLDALCSYLVTQRTRHDDSHPAERWTWEPAARRA
jgi:putative transposase